MQNQFAARHLPLYFVAILTVLFFIAGQARTASAVTVSSNIEGTLVKGDLPDVYFVGTDGKRYVFPNEKVYFSWYTDFSTVKTITNDELAAFPIGGNVTYRPGTRLVKIQTDPKVYAVAADGTLRWVPTEAVAQQLYGHEWAKMVDDVPDSFFTNYHQGAEISDTNNYDPTSEKQHASDIGVDKGIISEPSEQTDSHDDNNAGASANTNTNTNSAAVSFQFCPTGDNITEGCCASGGAAFTNATLPVTSGTLIKSAASPLVYYYSMNGKRYVMTNKDVLLSWSGSQDDILSGASTVCRNIKQLSAAELASIPIGGNADIRPGTYIIKIASDPKLYVVSHNRTIRPLATSSLAEQIFPGTSTKRLRTIPDSFFGGYKIGTTVTSASDYDPITEYNTTMEYELNS